MPAHDDWMKIDGGTVTLQGNLGTQEIPVLQQTLDQLDRDGHKDITIDLVNVDYLSSSYLGIIARAAADAEKRGGTLRLIVIGQVLRLIKLAGLDKVVALEKPQGWQAPPID